MARLSCTYKPDYDGVDITILIHDSAGGIFDPGAGIIATDFCTRPEGAIIRQEGNTRDVYQAIQPSSATFDMLVENAAHKQFLDDLALSEENRFSVEILRGDFTIFLGQIVIDEVIIEDSNSRAYWFTINASDGFAALQNIDYCDDLGNPYTGREILAFHLRNIFEKLPTYSLYQNSSVYLFTGIFAAEMPDHSTSPLEQARVDHAVFQKRSQDKITYLSCYDVLEHILHAFDARLIVSGFHIYIYSWNFYGNPTKDINTWIYPGIDMASSSEGMIAMHPIEACQYGVESEAGGVKVLQAPARSVSTHYRHGAGANWLFGKRFMDLDYSEQCYIAGTIPSLEEETRFHFTGNIRYFISENRQLITDGARFVLLIRIRIGTDYFVRTYGAGIGVIVRQPPRWDTTPDYYAIPAAQWAEAHEEDATYDYNETENFDILSDIIPLSASGKELEVCFTYKLINRKNQLLTQVDYPSSINVENPSFSFVKKENVLVEDTVNIITVVNTINNTRHFDRTLVFGDGPNPQSDSRMTVLLGGDMVDTTEWTDQHTGLGPYKHSELIARLMIARRINTLRFKEGPFFNYNNPLEPLRYDGLTYIPLLPEWITGQNKTAGEWVSISLGEAAPLDHTTLVEDDAKLAPGTPSSPSVGDISTRPIRKTYTGPLSEITPSVDLGDILTLPEDEQAAIVHIYKNGVKMNLTGAGTGINDFKIIDNSGPKLRPAFSFTAYDKIETLYNI